MRFFLFLNFYKSLSWFRRLGKWLWLPMRVVWSERDKIGNWESMYTFVWRRWRIKSGNFNRFIIVCVSLNHCIAHVSLFSSNFLLFKKGKSEEFFFYYWHGHKERMELENYFFKVADSIEISESQSVRRAHLWIATYISLWTIHDGAWDIC